LMRSRRKVDRPASRSRGDAAAPAAIVGIARDLGRVLDELGLTEVEVTWAGTAVRVQRSAPTAAVAQVAAPPLSPAATTSVTEPAGSSRVTVEAPMVGTFYRASSPTA